jgi:hypothetical protein
MPTTDADQKHPSLADAVSPLALTGMDQPLWLQNSSYPASLDRLLVESTLEPGVQGLTELAVSQRAAGANMSVDVAVGRAVVPMTDAPNMGSALVRSTAVNNLTVAGAPAAGTSRIDLVIARVYDASVIGGSINGWQLEIVTGTAASSPAAPATPASAIVLARLAVAAGQATVATANITDQRVIPGVWRPYAAVLTGGGGNPVLGTGGLVTGRYRQQGKTCDVLITIKFGPGSSGGLGNLTISVPLLPNQAAFAPLPNPAVGVCSTNIPAAAVTYFGVVLVSNNQLYPRFPISATNAASDFWRNTISGAAGQGCPQVAGYPIEPNTELSCSARYEVA